MTTSSLDSLPRWLKRCLALAFVLLACWAGAIVYWRMSKVEPTSTELLMILLALPAVLVAASWFIYQLLSRSSPAPITAPSVQPAPANPASASPAMAILATSLRLPHGKTTDELAEAIAQGKTNADLDPDLLDSEGFPVMTARSEDALDESLREEIADWFSSTGLTTLRLSNEQWRASILGTGVVRELAAHAVSLLMRPGMAPPALKLIPVLPLDWQMDQGTAVAKWFEHVVLEFGWPAHRLSIGVLAAGSEEIGPATFDQLAHDISSASFPSAAMVIVCASNIGQETVDQWAAGTMLFTASQAQGRVPGEGAAGMLWTKADTRAEEMEGTTLLHLETLEKKESQAPIPLEDLAKKVLDNATLTTKDVAVLVADTGTQNKRVLELMQFATTSMPQLDGATEVVRIGAISGSCGSVPFLASLALAHHYACTKKRPALAICNEGPGHACAALVRAPAPSLSAAPANELDAQVQV